MAKKKAETNDVLTVPVSYGNVNVGDKTARIGITIDRANMTAAQADKQLCGRRLRGRIEAKPNSSGDDPGQARMFDDSLELAATFDVKSIGLALKTISAGLTLNLANVDITKLAGFAKRHGSFIVEEVADLPDGEEADDE